MGVGSGSMYECVHECVCECVWGGDWEYVRECESVCVWGVGVCVGLGVEVCVSVCDSSVCGVECVSVSGCGSVYERQCV